MKIKETFRFIGTIGLTSSNFVFVASILKTPYAHWSVLLELLLFLNISGLILGCCWLHDMVEKV